MLYPHCMRLRGPWECEFPCGAAPRRVMMPRPWKDLIEGRPTIAAAETSTIRFVRKFGYPGRIDAHERVWLICEGLSGSAVISVNDQLVGQRRSGNVALEVTSILAPRNRLVIEMQPAEEGSPWDEVGLEIRCTAYLDDMQVTRPESGTLEARGRVVGSSDGPLELYGIADGGHVHYQAIEASTAGTPFHFPLPLETKQLRVDLVSVSTVWYAWEQFVGE